MAKAKKAPAAKTAVFRDRIGHPLAVGDRVQFESSTSTHSGGIGTVTAIYPREGDTVSISTVLLDKLSTWKEAPSVSAFSQNLLWLETPQRALDLKGVQLAEGDSVSGELGSAWATRIGTVVKLDFLPGTTPGVIVDFPATATEKADKLMLPCTCLVKVQPAPNPVADEAQAQRIQALRDTLQKQQEAADRGEHYHSVEDASTPEPAPVATEPAAEFRNIPLGEIHVTRNTRQVFDETPLQELAQSIKERGVIAPIVVRLNHHMGHPSEALYELVAGERRLRASKLAGLDTIPAMVRVLDDRAFIEVQLLENLQRVDVRPADEAQAFAELLNKHKFSAEEIALKVGKPVKFVLQRAKLAALTPFWMELLQAEKLPLVAAHLVARLPEAGQNKVEKLAVNSYSWALKSTGLDFGTVNGMISREIMRDLTSVPFPKDDETLYPKAGACLTCPKRSCANAGLFDDATGKDLCLDKPCYEQKYTLYVQRRLVELSAGGDKPICISADSYETKTHKGILGIVHGWGKYSKAKESDKNAVQALLVDGGNAGSLCWILFKGAKTEEEKQAEAKAQAKKLRESRETMQHRLLIVEKLREDFGRDLYSEGPIAHTMLNAMVWEGLTYGASAISKDMLDYLATHYNWARPDAGQMKNAYGDRDEVTKRTPHSQYVHEQLERMTVRDKLSLYFTVKFRSGLSSEWQNSQLRYAELIGPGYGYEELEAQAKKQVKAQFYGKEGANA